LIQHLLHINGGSVHVMYV